MEQTLSKKTKTACSIIAIAVFLILVYLGDSFIMPTSKWSMLMKVLEKGSIYALIAVSILALQDAGLAAKLDAFRAKQTVDVLKAEL